MAEQQNPFHQAIRLLWKSPTFMNQMPQGFGYNPPHLPNGQMQPPIRQAQPSGTSLPPGMDPIKPPVVNDTPPIIDYPTKQPPIAHTPPIIDWPPKQPPVNDTPPINPNGPVAHTPPIIDNPYHPWPQGNPWHHTKK